MNAISHGCFSFPARNFRDVVDEELSKDNYKYLVLGNSTADITNLKTDVDPITNLQVYEEEATKAAQSIFSLAEAALATFSSLEKVVLMKAPPRFDPALNDPMNLKPQLSALFNSAYFLES